MVKIKVFKLFLLLSVAVSAFAQSAAVPQTPAPREDVLRLIDKLRLKSTMELMLKQIVEQAKAGARQGFVSELPSATEEQKATMDKLMEDTFSEINVDEILQDVVPVYQKH